MTAEKKDAALLKLYKESFPDAARLVQRMGGTLEECKDVFHDALIIYLERKSKNEQHIKVSAKAYLIGTTKILWIQKKRQAYDRVPLFEVEDNIYTADEWSPEEKEKTVLQWMESAGQKCLQLLKAFYYDKQSMQELAQRFGYKGSRSATVQKYKCIERIRTEIKKGNTYAERVS